MMCVVLTCISLIRDGRVFDLMNLHMYISMFCLFLFLVYCSGDGHREDYHSGC